MNENAARLDWAGAGVRLPRRLVAPRARLAACARSEPALGDAATAACARRETRRAGRRRWSETPPTGRDDAGSSSTSHAGHQLRFRLDGPDPG